MNGEDLADQRQGQILHYSSSIPEKESLRFDMAKGILGHLAHLLLLQMKKLLQRREVTFQGPTGKTCRAKFRIQVSWIPGKPRGLVC